MKEYKVLKTSEEHQGALAEAERLVLLDPSVGSKEADRLELLSLLIEDYEDRSFAFEELDPIDVIEFRMEEQGLRQKDLVSMIGSRSRVSEVMARKRPLTVQMIRALSSGLNIPADALLGTNDSRRESAPIAEEPIDWARFPYKEMDGRGWFTEARVQGNSIAERLQSFLEELTLDSDREEEKEAQGDAVTLITMHSCKGLEFPHVHVVGLEDGLLPHSRSKVEGTLDEERRLFYVAITRAMKTLTLSYCLGRKKYGQVMPCHPSPFLKELPPELVENAAERNKQPVAANSGGNMFAAMREALD